MDFELYCTKCGHTEHIEKKDAIVAGRFVSWDMLKDIACDHCKEIGGLQIRTTGGLLLKRVDDDMVTLEEG